MESTTKIKLILSAIISPLVMYFDPYLVLLKAIGILVALDIITGILAKTKEEYKIITLETVKRTFKSRRFFSKVIHLGLFFLGLVAAKESSPILAEFGIEPHQGGKWFIALYGVYELFSVMENLGRLGLVGADLFSKFLKKKLPEDVVNEKENENK